MHNSAIIHGDKVNKWVCHPEIVRASGDSDLSSFYAFARVSRWVDGGTCCLCQQLVEGLANLFLSHIHKTLFLNQRTRSAKIFEPYLKPT